VVRGYASVLLLDSATGTPIAEHGYGSTKFSVSGTALGEHPIPFLREGGRAWFAGHPAVGGVITPIGDGKRDVTLITRRPSGGPYWEAELTMRPDRPLPLMPEPYVDESAQRPWLADHPVKSDRG
jgi:hypothetical protein